jgi:hypothetical protein
MISSTRIWAKPSPTQGQRSLNLTFRTSALDYLRIIFGAKLRGDSVIPAPIIPPARCCHRTAVAAAALPTQAWQPRRDLHGRSMARPPLVPGGPRDQPDDAPSWNRLQLHAIPSPAWSGSASRRGIPGTTSESKFLHVLLLLRELRPVGSSVIDIGHVQQPQELALETAQLGREDHWRSPLDA